MQIKSRLLKISILCPKKLLSCHYQVHWVLKYTIFTVDSFMKSLILCMIFVVIVTDLFFTNWIFCHRSNSKITSVHQSVEFLHEELNTFLIQVVNPPQCFPASLENVILLVMAFFILYLLIREFITLSIFLHSLHSTMK